MVVVGRPGLGGVVLQRVVEHHRKEKGEEAKVAIRNIRRDADKQFKKLKDEISEDVVADLQDDLQKETDKKIKEIDKAVEEKTKEILTV